MTVIRPVIGRHNRGCFKFRFLNPRVTWKTREILPNDAVSHLAHGILESPWFTHPLPYLYPENVNHPSCFQF